MDGPLNASQLLALLKFRNTIIGQMKSGWRKMGNRIDEKCHKSFIERWATQVPVMWRYCASLWRKTLPSRWAGPSTTSTSSPPSSPSSYCIALHQFVQVLVDLPGAGLPVSADRHWSLHSGHLAWCLGALWWFIPCKRSL